MDKEKLKELQSDFLLECSKIKNKSKRRRVAKQVKRNLQEKYGITL